MVYQGRERDLSESSGVFGSEGNWIPPLTSGRHVEFKPPTGAPVGPSTLRFIALAKVFVSKSQELFGDCTD